MLERDYITELISQFVEAVTRALKLAVEKGDPASCQAVEQQVADLIDLDAQTAMALSPDSLVTMLVLSGMGDSVASYVCYALDRVSRVYEAHGEEDLAGLRRLQSQAVGESFGCDPATPPEELASLDAELFGTTGEKA